MFPGDIKVDGLDGHPLVQFLHDGALVVVWPSEDVREEEDHRGVQFGNVRDIL